MKANNVCQLTLTGSLITTYFIQRMTISDFFISDKVKNNSYLNTCPHLQQNDDPCGFLVPHPRQIDLSRIGLRFGV